MQWINALIQMQSKEGKGNTSANMKTITVTALNNTEKID